MVNVAKTCKHMRPYGNESRFRDVHVALSNVSPCVHDVQFKNFLADLKHTRHLHVRTLDDSRGRKYFDLLLARIKDLKLRTLKFLDILSLEPYSALDKLLNSPEGLEMMSRLRHIQLPARLGSDGKWAGDKHPSSLRGEVFDCTAAIQFHSGGDETGEKKKCLRQRSR